MKKICFSSLKVLFVLSISSFGFLHAVIDRQNLKETARVLVEVSSNIKKSFQDISDQIKSLNVTLLLPDIKGTVNSDPNITHFKVSELK